MISNLKQVDSRHFLLYVSEPGIYRVTIHNEGGLLIFEHPCWEMVPNVQHKIWTNAEIVRPHIRLTKHIPNIKYRVDNSQNRIYISCDENITLNIQLVDGINNDLIWENTTDFKRNEVWFEPYKKLASWNQLQLEIKNKFGQIVYLNNVVTGNWIFCHIPKNAGVSIKKTIVSQITDPAHKVYERVESDPFSFAFVRNPYTRVISAYQYLKAGGMCELDRLDAENYISGLEFSQFVKLRLQQASDSQQHFRPQWTWIPNGVSYLGRVESIDSDLSEICKIIGLDTPILKKENQSPKEPIELTPELKEIIYQVYKEDFIRFGYQK